MQFYDDPSYKPEQEAIPLEPKNYFIFDCDAGADDAHGMILAFYNRMVVQKQTKRDIKILGITSCYGNTTMPNSSDNLAITLELIKQAGITVEDDLKIYNGSQFPIMINKTDENFFGLDGISGFQSHYKNEYPDYQQNIDYDVHAVDFIIEQIKDKQEKLSLVCTGTLTNLALAIIKYPDLCNLIGQVYIMGGTYKGHGNTPYGGTEYNIYIDPHAAKIVFSKLTDIVMLPLDTIYDVQQPQLENELFNSDTKIGQFVNRIYKNTKKTCKFYYMCDPLTYCVIFDHDLVLEYYHKNCQIETQASMCMGQTVIDWRGQWNLRSNTYIIKKLDMTKITEQLREAIKCKPTNQ